MLILISITHRFSNRFISLNQFVFFQTSSIIELRCKDDAVVRALASHRCGPGSIPRLGVICGLRLLVLYAAPGVSSASRTPDFPSPQKPAFDLICEIVNFGLQCPSSARTTGH